MDRFKDHIAKYCGDRTQALGCVAERLTFGKPGTSIDYIEFVAIGCELIVRGDLFDAIYAVSRTHPMSFWHNTDLGYFSSKLAGLKGGEASSEEVWDESVAAERLVALKAELAKDVFEECKLPFELAKEDAPELLWEDWLHTATHATKDDQLGEKTLELKNWTSLNPEEYLESKFCWDKFLSDNGSEIWGDYFWESGVHVIGMKRNPSIVLHKTALDAAFAQLKANKIDYFK